MWKVKYSNIWPNQTIVSDQSELTILLCQPMIIYVCIEDDVNWVQRPSTFHILYTWSLAQTYFICSGEELQVCRVWIQLLPQDRPGETPDQCSSEAENSVSSVWQEILRSQTTHQTGPWGSQGDNILVYCEKYFSGIEKKSSGTEKYFSGIEKYFI